ncbi:MAG: SdpI family protein [Candidatus Falkowbacteria bacterium]
MKMPFKLSIKTELVPLVFITATVATVLCFYNNLPEKVASHWNFAGQVDGWSSNTFHGIFFPLLIISLYALLLILPMVDPHKENYQKFLGTYHIFKGLIIATLFTVYLSATIFNLGYNINVGVIVATTIGIFMMIMGFYLRDIKENWFIGIKTPWTLSSTEVWEKTHKFGSWLFMFFGLVIIATPHLPAALAIPLFIIGILGVTLGTFLYSYIIFKKLGKKKKK